VAAAVTGPYLDLDLFAALLEGVEALLPRGIFCAQLVEVPDQARTRRDRLPVDLLRPSSQAQV
jgi:hypothetical protein